MRKDKQTIDSAAFFDPGSPLDQLAKQVAVDHQVDGHDLIRQVAMIGDKTNDEILSRIGIDEDNERIRHIHALGKVRNKLGVWPDRD